MPFSSAPIVLCRSDGVTFEIVTDVDYVGAPQYGDRWTVPAGFRTDFATIPAVVSWAIPKLGAYTLAAIVHDLLCEGLNRWYKDPAEADPPTAGPRDTDAVMRRIMREHDVDPVTMWLVWTGVRWGALANPARRPGWLRDAPLVLAISALAAPIVLPASVFAVGGRLLLRGLGWLPRHIRKRSKMKENAA